MAIEPKDLNLSTLAKHFSDEAAAYEFVESIRWPAGKEDVVCPHCGTIGRAYYLAPKNGGRLTRTGKVSLRRVWKCGACRKQFSVLVGTIFEDSKIPLFKWLLAFHLIASAKNGIAAYELHRMLQISVESAWFMAHRIRYALEGGSVAPLTGTVEADETYIGGKARNMHASKRRRRVTGTGGIDKTAVVSLVQRGGELRSQVMQETVTGATLGAVLREHVSPAAHLRTDAFGGYRQLGREFASHETVNHQAGEYVRGDASTNTLEGYFSQLKRSIDGTHHHVSAHHLHRYVGEFDFRYNTRTLRDGERTVQAIRQSAGKRLTYS